MDARVIRLCPMIAAAGLLAAAATPAQAVVPAKPVSWGVVGGWGNAPGNSSVTSIASTGKDDSFAAGPNCTGPAPCQPSMLEFDHWNGSKWVPIAPPAGLTTATRTLSTAVVGASAKTNAWVFAGLSTGVTKALRWDGKHWKTISLGSARVTSAAVFGVKNAWAFGTTATGTPRSLRYNGTKWSLVHPPAEPQTLSAPAANDMWAIGPTTATAAKAPPLQKLVAIHWNGSSWRTLALPKVSKPAGDYVTTGSIVALGPSNVWEAYGLGNFGTCCAYGGLEHWNGSKWQAVSVPKKPQHLASAASLAQDGHGGLWMLGRTATGFAFYHLSAGKWSQSFPPTFVNVTFFPAELSWLPGTRRLWAGGSGDNTNGTDYAWIMSNVHS
jgi:hypothetical protein